METKTELQRMEIGESKCVIARFINATIATGPVFDENKSQVSRNKRCLDLTIQNNHGGTVQINMTAQQAGELASRLMHLITQTPDFLKEEVI